MNDYRIEADADARETIAEYREEILTQLTDKGEASDDLYNDYPDGDSYHHENHVDRYYDLSEAVDVIEQLYEHEETDSGLWEGIQPKEAIGICAAFTYGNAVYAGWVNLIEEINGEAFNIIANQKTDFTAIVDIIIKG